VFLGNDVLLNEVNYIFFIILIKFVIFGRDVTVQGGVCLGSVV